VTLQRTNSLTTESIPDLALKVIVTSKQESAGNGECHGGDTADGLANSVALQFSVGADIEKTARSIVGTSTESISVGEELNGVDV